MRFWPFRAAIFALFGVALMPHSALAQDGELVARGHYLVEMAGQCSDCHGAKLHGQRLDFLNPKSPPVVQRSAPGIAGLPGPAAERQAGASAHARLPLQ